MPKLAANISLMFTEVPFLERFGLAAACGFDGVEFLFPYAFAAEDIADALTANNLTNALFNMYPGDMKAGERGLAGLPGREAEFAESVEQALHYARSMGTRNIHVMHGVPDTGMDPEACRATFVSNLKYAAAKAAEDGITLLVEPLNTRDNPGYPLNLQEDARDVVNAVGAPNLKIQFDFYHCQIVQGDVAMTFQEVYSDIGHIQISGVPDRHEPDTGEVNYPFVLHMIDNSGYEGWVGCEYRPAGNTLTGLDWAAPYGIHQPR